MESNVILLLLLIGFLAMFYIVYAKFFSLNLHKEPTVRKHPIVYTVGGSWGNIINIDVIQNDLLYIIGFKTIRPREGDLLLTEMKSGRKALYVLYDINLYHDPNDMFKGKAKFLCFTDDSKNIYLTNKTKYY